MEPYELKYKTCIAKSSQENVMKYLTEIGLTHPRSGAPEFNGGGVNECGLGLIALK